MTVGDAPAEIGEIVGTEAAQTETAAHADRVARQTGIRRPRRQPRWHGYTAFVLSGGGARGAFQVGMLRALLEFGETPDVVIGTSVGSWNGAWLARRPTLEGVEVLTNIWRTLKPAHVLLGRDPAPNTPSQALRGMLVLAAARRATQGQPSLYSDAGLQQLLHRHLGGVQFEDLAVPLHVIATDLTAGERAIFGSGPLAPALLASSAIPGIFPPVTIGTKTYVDGGALDNASIETALAQGARRIWVLDVGFDSSSEGETHWDGTNDAKRDYQRSSSLPHAIAAVLERTTQVMSRYQLRRDMALLPPGVETHVLSASTPGGGAALEFARAPEWIERGYDIAKEYLRTSSRLAARQQRAAAE